MSLRKVISVTAHASLTFSATVTVKVIRGSWRRKLQYLYQDTLADLKQRMIKIKRYLRRKKPSVRKRTGESTTATPTDHMYFVEKPWDKEPAIDLLDKYLERLQVIVNDAATHFAEHRQNT